MMERRFDMSDFEQSLKDHVDQFRLTPSRRVWNGIYNHLHPGSKWPSITVAIVFIITLFTIGHLNNSPKNWSSGVDPSSDFKSIDKNYSKPTNNFNSALKSKAGTAKNKTSLNNNKTVSPNNNGALKNSGNEKLNDAIIPQPKETFKFINEDKAGSSNEKNISLNTKENIHGNKITINSDAVDHKIISQKINESKNEISKEDYNLFMNSLKSLINKFLQKEPEYSIAMEPLSLTENTVHFSSMAGLRDPSPLETHIRAPEKTINQSKKFYRKKNKNIEWTYYVAPMVSKPVFRNNSSASSMNFSPLGMFQRTAANGMMYNAKFGFETGAKMTYSLSKKWKFVTGFNLNYSDYSVISNLLHPTFATLSLKDQSTGVPYSKSYITFYGNGQSLNQVALTNYSLQFSIPVGLEYQVWGNKKVQISVASVIEPSVVLKSNAYIISADKKYYVQDPDLMRKMNLGGNFGTFITFGSNKIKWHIGPDIHYQLLSTYKSYYPSKEHLINYGIRIGISKKY